MNLSLLTGDALRSPGDLLVLALFDADLAKPTPELAAADEALDGHLLQAAREEGFKAKAEQTFTFHTHGKLQAPRVALLGLGGKKDFDPEVLRLAAGRAAKLALRLKTAKVTFSLPAGVDGEVAVRAAAEGLLLGSYRFDRYRTQSAEAKEQKPPAAIQLHLPDGVAKSAALNAAVALAGQIGTAVNWARDLVNEPACVITPTALGEAVTAACMPLGLDVKVEGLKQIDAMRMGMFRAVGQGSAQEPQLIQVIYTPKNAEHAKRKPLALVGKAITFDSGGLSLKTTEGMLDMKVDMAGSAAVFGAMQVIAKLAPPFPVHAFVGACENMPSGTSYKLGDVLVSRLGKTVEVTNTDAEGRLVLGDILAWACEHDPFQVVDLATLTGACMIALGHHVVGAFGMDDAAVDAVLASAKTAGEAMWRMPIVELQKDTLRSDIADMKNSGERYGGAINAAIFLREFVGQTPWVHLDIAGPATSPRERGYLSKGATGVGVRTLVELVRRHAASPPTALRKAPAAAAKKSAGGKSAKAKKRA